jgi:hypothetical protein
MSLSFSVTQPASLDVNFDTETKYTNGITALATDHVSVTSSRGYVVKAIAGTVTGSAAIAPGSVKITSAVGATNNGNTTGITYGSAVTYRYQVEQQQQLLQQRTLHGAVRILQTNSTFLT